MAGVGLRADFSAVRRAAQRIEQLGQFDRNQLLDVIGGTVESQTRRRIEEDKAAPDGSAWPDWSDEYKETRHGGHGLLENEGDLIGSIGFSVYFASDEVEVGSNLIYAATHDQGDEDRGIPQRQFLGLSNDDRDELDDVVDRFIDSLIDL